MNAVECPSFEPAFTKEQVLSFEETHNETWGVNRRLMMMTLARSSGQLIDSFADSADDSGDALFALIDQISDYGEHLNSGMELAEAAVARLLMVGQFIAEG